VFFVTCQFRFSASDLKRIRPATSTPKEKRDGLEGTIALPFGGAVSWPVGDRRPRRLL
jgi:hypothetical protein